MIRIVTSIVLAAVMALTTAVPASADVILPGGSTPREQGDQYRHRDDRYRPGYWHGHRGYRDYRPGYRRHSDGWWYPLALFGLGAAITGNLARPAPAPQLGVALPTSHVRWCQGRYRSYDAYSNTFQPYNGPRQQCLSPYWR
jgi:hypothetical protein